MGIEIVGKLSEVETIAVGRAIREVERLRAHRMGRKEFKMKRLLGDN